MTKIALVACACLLGAASSAAAGPEAAAGRQASLRAIDLQPLIVRGIGVEPGERVRLILSSAAEQRWRTTVATPRGSLTMGFGVSIGGCGRFTVQAFGSRGSRARLFPTRTQIDCVSPDRGGSTTHGDSTK
jgi:hypothetical protein